MTNHSPVFDETSWLSTYGLLTAERILETLHVELETEEIAANIKRPESVYYKLLRLPIRHVFNGLILQQANDYQICTQKLFVDYFLSGQADRPPESAGASIREALEQEHEQLKSMNQAFEEQSFEYEKLVADSQYDFIKVAKRLQQTIDALYSIVQKYVGSQQEKNTLKKILHQLIAYHHDADWLVKTLNISDPTPAFQQQISAKLDEMDALSQTIENLLTTYQPKTKAMMEALKQSHQQFYDLIQRTRQLMYSLPEYPGAETQGQHLESLEFDHDTIGKVRIEQQSDQ